MKKSPLLPYKILEASDLSAPQISKVTDIRYQDNVAIVIKAEGAPAGIFQVQISLDYQPADPASGTWGTLTSAIVNTPDEIFFDLNQLSAPFIRLIFSPDVGSTGTANAVIAAKGA